MKLGDFAMDGDDRGNSNHDRAQGPLRVHRRDVLGRLLGITFVPLLGTGFARANPSDHAPPLIMLDPGHGGHDPGAIGVTGLFEKYVALATAQDLKTALEATGRYRVVLTRNDDVYVPLEQRSAFALSEGARLFVSIHADALSDKSVRGASVYTLAREASDAQSHELARRENSVDPTAAKEYGAYSPEVATILESLAAREARVLSAGLQRDVVSALSQQVMMLHRPSRHADFVVLRDTVPSVLVEMGFMSNHTDEVLLETAAHRQRVVSALTQGIETCMASFAQMTQAG